MQAQAWQCIASYAAVVQNTKHARFCIKHLFYITLFKLH